MQLPRWTRTGRGHRNWCPAVVLAVSAPVGCYQGAKDPPGGTGDSAGTEGTDGEGGDGDGDSGETGGDDPPPPPGQEFECAGEVDPGPNLIRRLTNPEYVASVQAVTGINVGAEAAMEFPADLRADGFSNTNAGLIVTLDHVQAYERLAALAVEMVGDLEQLAEQYTSCADFSEGCKRELVDAMGLRLFRGPIQAPEREALLPLFDVVEEEGDGFPVAVGLVAEAMLQSPRFLYRVETETGDGALRELDGYELAARLSYLAWGAPPDDDLYAAAADDALVSDEQIESQLRRMLADDRARGASRKFAADWVHLARLDNLPRDPDKFPAWDPALGRAMQDETLALFESVAWDEGRPVTDLFDAQQTMVTPDLAEHYGFASQPGDAFYDLSGVPERGGLLTHGSVLTLGGNDASMVARGQFILETFLCGRVASPPDGVDTTPPEVEPGRSQRSYSEDRTSNPACAGCHRQLEPPAWGIERFLADGSYRQEDALGNPLLQDGSLWFPGDAEPTPFSSIPEMMQALAESERVRDCFSLKSVQFALGRPLLASDGCSLAQVRDRFAQTDGTYEDLLVAIALSPGFRTIRSE